MFFGFRLTVNRLHDLATNQVITAIPVGKDPLGLALDESTDTVIVTNKKDNTLSVIDLNTRTVTATIPVGKSPVDEIGRASCRERVCPYV